MGDNNTKWEPVLRAEDVSNGDTIRALHEDGSCVVGRAQVPPNRVGGFLENDVLIVPVARLTDHGYRFERAVPERTLPTEYGIYTHESEPFVCDLYELDQGGWYSYASGEPRWVARAEMPDGLARLVPSTEADELRDRIAVARAYYQAQNFGDAHIDRIFSLLDGEA